MGAVEHALSYVAEVSKSISTQSSPVLGTLVRLHLLRVWKRLGSPKFDTELAALVQMSPEALVGDEITPCAKAAVLHLSRALENAAAAAGVSRVGAVVSQGDLLGCPSLKFRFLASLWNADLCPGEMNGGGEQIVSKVTHTHMYTHTCTQPVRFYCKTASITLYYRL